MRRNLTRAAVGSVAAAGLVLALGAPATAAPSNKNTYEAGTGTCGDWTSTVTFNRGNNNPVAFLQDNRVLLARHVDGLFTGTVLRGDEVIDTVTDPIDEDIAGGVRPGMRITDCTFDFRSEESATVTEDLLAELAGEGVDVSRLQLGDEITIVFESEGNVLGQLVGKPR